jgi:hypothetical protein
VILVHEKLIQAKMNLFVKRFKKLFFSLFLSFFFFLLFYSKMLKTALWGKLENEAFSKKLFRLFYGKSFISRRNPKQALSHVNI